MFYKFKKGFASPGGWGACLRAISLVPVVLAGLVAATPSNSVDIIGLSGQAPAPQPFTISRVFAQGEIPDFAQAVADGTALQTQCDVKTRWRDGSVQHALVSFVATAGGNGISHVQFINQPDGSNSGFLTKSEILSPAAPWAANLGALVTAAQGSSQTVDLLSMLTAWDGSDDPTGVRYWLKGPVVTQLIVEDKNPDTLAYDFGWDCSTADSPCSGGWTTSTAPAAKSLHPIFVLTLYVGFPQVKIEAILENTWSTKLKDQSYALEIRLGNPPAVTPAYSNSDVSHIALTRWRKVFWSGPQPPPTQIDHNLPYLIQSRAIPSFDLTKVVGPADIGSEVNLFRTGDRGDIGGHAEWMQAFPTTGGRPDIGLFPRWYVRYLYTFDPGLYEVMLGDAEAGAHVPVHYRESLVGRTFSSAQAGEAFGHVISIDARPTFRTTLQAQDALPPDLVLPIGPVTSGNWIVDLAHQSSFAYIPYLITGDWYFLEEMYFWASYDVANGNPGISASYHRHGNWGFLNDSEQIRGVAWGLRNLAHAAFMAPDGSVEKSYFTEKLNNNIAVREGEYNITGGAFYEACQTAPYNPSRETSKWCWGRKTAAQGLDNPLHFFEAGSSGATQGLNVEAVYAASSPWMLNYNHIVLGHLEELGFPVTSLRQTMAVNLLNQILNPDYNPFLIASYRIPVLRQPDHAFIPAWGQVKAGFTDASATSFAASDLADAEHGYSHIAQAAASFLPGINDGSFSGEAAWEWVSRNVGDQDLLNSNPKWALVPRTWAAQQLQTSYRRAGEFRARTMASSEK